MLLLVDDLIAQSIHEKPPWQLLGHHSASFLRETEHALSELVRPRAAAGAEYKFVTWIWSMDHWSLVEAVWQLLVRFIEHSRPADEGFRRQ